MSLTTGNSPAGTAGRTAEPGRRPGEQPGGDGAPDTPGPRRKAASPATWCRDLLLGMRFATNGRAGWARTALTAVGVGVGVTLLLLAASVPHLLASRHDRDVARENYSYSERGPKPGPDTLLYDSEDTEYHGRSIRGRVMDPDGDRPPLPPGVSEVPGPGDMVVSPELRRLLDSSDGGLLRERLDYRVVGTVGDEGLSGPKELTYYAGSDSLTTDDATRIDHFGEPADGEPLNAILVLLIVVICVVLLMPVAVFIGTAVRFGGERRDRRLAALRLVGADVAMTRRVAAGEALAGALLGMAVGVGLFLLGRGFAGDVTVLDVNVFPSDVAPNAALAVLVALAVPASSVAVTLFALRGVTIEPLGVVRHAAATRRRLWWRLLPLVVGLLMLLMKVNSVSASSGDVDTYQIAAGAVLMLFGVTALLPWVVEALVDRFHGGSLSWQLALRRLQLSSGNASRAVSGITVAVAGAIAIQMLFSSVEEDFTTYSGAQPAPGQMAAHADVRGADEIAQVTDAFRHTDGARVMGVTVMTAVGEAGAARDDTDAPTEELTVADCRTLRRMARLSSCADGDVFHVQDTTGESGDFARPGGTIDLTPPGYDHPGKEHRWTLPATVPTVEPRDTASFGPTRGLLATPAAVPVSALDEPMLELELSTDADDRDAVERVRNTAAHLPMWTGVYELTSERTNNQYRQVRTGLFVGATLVLLMIGVSMVVSMLEQLRERRKLLSVLVAFGTRRSTLALSVLWQTAVPVVLGLALSVAGGLGLGWVLVRMTGEKVQGWMSFLPMVGVGATVIAAVTLISLPVLWRMMRPDGLRTE